MSDWFAKATMIDWVLFIAVTGSAAGRLLAWWFRERRMIDRIDTLVTKQDLKVFELKYDAEIKHWVRSILGGYMPTAACRDRNQLTDERLRRLETKDES